MIIRPRTDWQAATQKVTGPPYPAKSIVDVVYHYPGAAASATFTDPVRVLRVMQADYLTNRGYSLGYSYAIDPTGVCWEIRGVDIRPAATAGYNDKGCAVQFMVPGQARANDAQMSAAVDLHLWLEKQHRRQLGVTGHRFRGTTPTPCPGLGVTAQLPEIARRIRATPTPPPGPPGPAPTGGTPVFVARYHSGHTYLVQANLDETFAKHNITGKDQYLHLIGAGMLPFMDDRDWDAWLAAVPEV